MDKNNIKDICLFTIILFICIYLCFGIIDKNKDQYEFVIGVSQPNLIEPWRIAMNNDLKKKGDKFKNINIVFKDSGGLLNQQKTDIENLIQSGIDLLIVSMPDKDYLAETIKEVYKAIPVMIIESDFRGYDYSMYVGLDNGEIGKRAGRITRYALEKDGGKVLEVQGTINSFPSERRSNAFMMEVEKNSNIKILNKLIGEWDSEIVEEKMIKLLEYEKDIDIIFCHDDNMALGVVNAIKGTGLNINDYKIIGVGGLKGKGNGIDLIENGILYATFESTSLGDTVLEYAIKLLNDEDVPKRLELSSDVLRRK